MSDQDIDGRVSTVPMVPPILALAIMMPAIYAFAKVADFTLQHIEIVSALVFAPLATWIVYGHWAFGRGRKRQALLATLLSVPLGYGVATEFVRHDLARRAVEQEAVLARATAVTAAGPARDRECRESIQDLQDGKWLGMTTFDSCYHAYTREESTAICKAQTRYSTVLSDGYRRCEGFLQ